MSIIFGPVFVTKGDLDHKVTEGPTNMSIEVFERTHPELAAVIAAVDDFDLLFYDFDKKAVIRVSSFHPFMGLRMAYATPRPNLTAVAPRIDRP